MSKCAEGGYCVDTDGMRGDGGGSTYGPKTAKPIFLVAEAGWVKCVPCRKDVSRKLIIILKGDRGIFLSCGFERKRKKANFCYEKVQN